MDSGSCMWFMFFFFFFNDTATTEIYTLSLHDALPILVLAVDHPVERQPPKPHPPPGRCDAHELALVSATKDEAVCHHFAFRYLDLIRAVVVGEGASQLSYALLEPLGQLGSHQLVEDVEVTCAYRFGHSVGDGLVLLGEHASSPLGGRRTIQKIPCPVHDAIRADLERTPHSGTHKG